jgi:anti-sigma-K factor RskA
MEHTEYEDLISLDAVGALEADEAARLKTHLRECAECRRSHDEARETAALMALSASPVEPPAHVRRQVLEAIRPASVTELAPRRTRLAPWWLAAAAVLLVALAIWNAMAIRRSQRQLEIASGEITRLRNENQAAQQSRAELERRLQALTGAGATIELSGQEVAPSASARAFVDPDSRTALVFFQNLPPTPADKSYQLWIIRADRPAPQSAGVFEVGPDGKATLGLENLPVNTEIKAFAVTLEPRGGVAAPTGAKYLIGS